MSELKPFDEFMDALVHCDTVKVILTGCGESTFETKPIHERICALANRRAQPANEPLTLEQLLEMNGEPVWCDWIGGWGLIHIYDENKIEFTYCDGSQNTYDEIVDCGISPLAYYSKSKEKHNETDRR